MAKPCAGGGQCAGGPCTRERSQQDLTEQLRALQAFAAQQGFCDAADFLTRHLERAAWGAQQ